MSNLTWEDLLVNAPDQEHYANWMAPWHGLLEGPVGPLFLNRFGCWFLRRMDGSTEFFDVLTGGLETVARNPEEFAAKMNHRPWQEAYLLTEVVYGLHVVGCIAAGTQCYALIPHPALGGKNPHMGGELSLEDVMLMDAGLWQGICRQSIYRADA